MAFKDLTQMVGPATKIFPSSISVQQKGVIVRPARTLLDQLGWQAGDKVRPFVGTDEDEGLVLIKKAAMYDRGWTLVDGGGRGKPNHKVSPVIKIPARIGDAPSLPQLPERLRPTELQIEIYEDGLRFVLPWYVRPEPAPAPEVVMQSTLPPVLKPPKAKAAEPATKDSLDPRLLEFLRESVSPMVKERGHHIKKDPTGTKLVFDGVIMGIEDILQQVNEICGYVGDQRITLPPELEAHQ